MLPLTASEIATLVGGSLEGDPGRPLLAVRDLREAGSRDVAFFSLRPGLGGRGPSQADLADFAACRAGLLLLDAEADAGGRPCVRVKQPALAATMLARHFAGLDPRGDAPAVPPRGPTRIHPQATVDETAQLGVACQVGPGCVVRAGARLGAGVVLSERVSIGEGSEIGERSCIGPGAVIYPRVRIGKRCNVQANAVIGAPGFGFAWNGTRHLHMPQLGGVLIGDEVEIGSGTCIDAGTFKPTTIGDGAIIDNLVQIGHNCQLGRGVVVCGQVGFAGGVQAGDGAIFGGKAGINGHVKIGAGAIIGGASVVSGDLEPGVIVQGSPAIDIKLHQRMQATLRLMTKRKDRAAPPLP
jgi:UDP-3-O-[3-hydroxymyristoyl] glucosamine N-acyltransferase